MSLPFTHPQYREVFATCHRWFWPVVLLSWGFAPVTRGSGAVGLAVVAYPLAYPDAEGRSWR